MTNRLAELKLGGQVQVSFDGDNDGGNPFEEDGHAGLARNDVSGGASGNSSSSNGGGGPPQSGSMARFFEDVDMVKKGISTIKEATTTVSVLTQESIMATSTEKETQLSAEMNPSIKKANKDAQFTKKMLNALKEETTAMRIGVEKGEKGCSVSDLRIRENLLSTLTRKFVEVMKEYQASQAKYKTEIMKKTKRQIQIVKPDATEEEMDVVIRSGGADKMIQEQILTGEASESLKFMYQNINDRYNEILAIEASVQELHQLFLDMALLVEQQGELLDSIEFQVKQTEEHIDSANIQMTGAIKHLRNVRKTQLYCCCALMIILGIVILVVLIMQGKNNGGSTTTTVVTPVPTHMPTTRPLSLEEEQGLGSAGMGAMIMGTAPKRLREIIS